MPARPPAAGRAAPRVRRGFTLVELLIALGLATAVATGFGALAQGAARAASLSFGRLEAQQAVRRCLERITEELRWAEAVVPDPACGASGLCADRLTVRVPSGNPYRGDEAYEVTFQHNARQQELERRVGRGVNNLASPITQLEFSHLDARGAPVTSVDRVARVRVRASAALSNGGAILLGSEVMLRNRGAALPAPGP
ncbi:MAG: prepilin-type N-terminal cleavage/methylation domain-containing protein [Armatimonadota bacterium]|nr:prepilin-type N-terminal cleavage/methylation domain-containing protein [Armatimonadota bacterium]